MLSFLIQNVKGQQADDSYRPVTEDSLITLVNNSSYQKLIRQQLKYQLKGYYQAQIITNGSDYQIKKNKKYTFNAIYLDGEKIEQKGLLEEHHQILLNRVKTYTNNGYPFYRIRLDSISGTISSASLYFNSTAGRFIVNNELINKGTMPFNKKALTRLCKWPVGKPYNHQQFLKTSRQLNLLPYLKSSINPQIQFTPDSANLYLNLSKKVANQFNLLIGLQNNENTGKAEVIADVNLSLFHLLKRTDELNLQWSTPSPGTQELDVRASLPFLFGSPFGYLFELALLKQDSTFIRTRIKNGIVLKPSFNTQLSFYIGKNQLAELNSDNNVNPSSETTYGIRISTQKTDNIFNPSKGYEFNTDIQQGRRRINVGDSTNVRNTFQAFGFLKHYLPVRIITFYQHLQIGIQTQKTPTEAQFEIGGLKSFRGVNERFLQSEKYALYQFNPRYLLGEFGFLELFTDQLLYETPTNKIAHLMSFGGGFAIATKGGIFNFSFAIANLNNQFLIREGKVHFGYISVF